MEMFCGWLKLNWSSDFFGAIAIEINIYVQFNNNHLWLKFKDTSWSGFETLRRRSFVLEASYMDEAIFDANTGRKVRII